MTSKLTGGKTPPRLLQDLKLYNPHRLPASRFNILVDIPPPYTENGPLPKKTGKGACKHNWSFKPNQSSDRLPNSEDEDRTYKCAAFCAECRSHLSCEVIVPEGNAESTPCPNLDAPLHHFVYTENASPGFAFLETPEPDHERWGDQRHFKCSITSCSAVLIVRMFAPRLKKEWVDLLTDNTQIAKRADAVMAADPSRFEGHAVPSPLQVLYNLYQYISNARKGEDKKINGTNKKWMLSLGEPCYELLQFIYFSRTEDGWLPPHPELSHKVPFTNEVNIMLDDVVQELSTLMMRQPEEQRRTLRMNITLSPAIEEFQKLLGCTKYETNPASRNADLSSEDEHPYYAGLGSTLDFHDHLITFAYYRQIASNSVNSPYYLDCLQGIATGRRSEDLQTRVAIEASSGKVSLMDIKDAYKAFGFDVHGPHNEDTIIGTFESRIADAPRQEADLRRALKIIGEHIGSKKIEDRVSDVISNYTQALEWLGATPQMDESFLISMYSLKVNENALNEKLARSCISMIAEKRNSQSLRTWLETGFLAETEMDTAQAYARLNISDRTIDNEFIVSAYSMAVEDAPSQVAELNRALRSIAKDRESLFLFGLADTKTGATSEHRLSEWPVGLENIGNTCYLNSLLQFYFTIKPLRDLVLDFDEYKMTVDAEALERKQVGSRKVLKREVERSQRFVYELQNLFRSMIVADKRQITPDRQLARLTLISSNAEEIIRRASMVSGTRPVLNENLAKAGQGALPADSEEKAPISSGDDEKVTAAGRPVPDDRVIRDEEMSSEGTLVDATGPGTPLDNDFMVIDSVEKEQQAEALEDKENLAPMKYGLERPSTPDTSLKPLAESSPSRVNEQGHKSPTKEKNMSEMAVSAPAAPDRPPPVPPRDRANTQKNTLQQEEEDYARQQDVTEVIGNVLFQLQCAVKADEIDETGEQIDKIKKLFFGKLKVTTTDGQGKSRTKEEFFSDLKINVHSGPQDLYAAIDASLDREMVTVGTSKEAQYTTISMLPPMLQIHPNRTGYDRVKAAPFKVNHHLEFKDTIYMDRYMDSSDPDVKRRRDECWEWKEELRRIEARQTELLKTDVDLDMSEALSTTAKYLRTLHEMDAKDKDPDKETLVSPSLADCLEQASRDVKEELSSLAERAQALQTRIDSQFSTLKSLPYRLHAVFIHRGVVTSGHYWIYIFDFKQNVWRRYNDGYVAAVTDPEAEIFTTEKTDRPATPMFLVYVKQGMEKELVDAVCRDVVAGADGQQGGSEEQGEDVWEGLGEGFFPGPGGDAIRHSNMDHATEDLMQGMESTAPATAAATVEPLVEPLVSESGSGPAAVKGYAQAQEDKLMADGAGKECDDDADADADESATRGGLKPIQW